MRWTHLGFGSSQSKAAWVWVTSLPLEIMAGSGIWDCILVQQKAQLLVWIQRILGVILVVPTSE